MAKSSADYVVVGAGLAGCVVAHRLRSRGYEVTLLEAGKDPSGNPNATTALGGFALVGSEFDWCYKSTPQSTTYQRAHNMAAGKALGGGTTINYGGWLRGDAGDYNTWADLVGDQRWSYEGLLPWFRKAENFFDTGANKRQHGFEGPMHITSVTASDPNRRYPLREPIRKAWAELDVAMNPDNDSGSVAGIAEFHENSKDGRRQPSHLTYSLEGVQVFTEALVSRVLFNKDVASGVELSDGRRIDARKEVILCAGSIRTPQILMLSGIGPSDILNKHGIQTVKSLPSVGRNLHDHFALFLAFRLKDPERGLALGKLQDPAFFKGLPFDWVINELDKPAAVKEQIEMEATNDPFAESLLTYPRPLVETFSMYAPGGVPGIPADGTHIAGSTMILNPTSRGSISISSTSASDPPNIDTCYLSTEVDRAGLTFAVRRILKAMLATEAMKDFIEAEAPPSGDPLLEGLTPLTADASDAEILDRIERTGTPHCHSGGTAAMGNVVDTEGKVFGVKSLRVVDASVVPVPTAGHPQATLYPMAEQLSAMILGEA